MALFPAMRNGDAKDSSGIFFTWTVKSFLKKYAGLNFY
jgi:hypothetical protein